MSCQDAAIPLLCVYPKKVKILIWKDTNTPVFITVLFVMARIWKLPKCPLMGEWIMKMWSVHTHTHTHTRILLSHKKRNIAICNNIDGPWGCHAKWNKSEKDKYRMISLIHGIKKKHLNKTKLIEKKLIVAWGEVYWGAWWNGWRGSRGTKFKLFF